MFGSRITNGKRVKIRSISAFKPNTPSLQHSNTLHVGITQIATDIPITTILIHIRLCFTAPALGFAAAWKKTGFIDSVHPEMVDFGSGQGRNAFATAGVASYVEDCKRVRTQAWAERCRLWIGTN